MRLVIAALALIVLAAGLTGSWWGQWISDPAWRTCIVASNCGVNW